jgi:hypothetical protein
VRGGVEVAISQAALLRDVQRRRIVEALVLAAW